MKCLNHRAADAVAICAHCGRALCPDCMLSPTATRVVCSQACSAAAERNDNALQLLLQKSTQSAQASAFYCYLTGGLSAAAALVAWFMLPSPFLIMFTGGCAVVLIASGIWHGRGAKRQNADKP